MPDRLETIPWFHPNPDSSADGDGIAAMQIHDFYTIGA